MKKLFFIGLINLIPFTRFYSIKRLFLKKAGVSVGENTKIAGKIQISNSVNLVIGSNVWIGDNFKIYNSGNGTVTIENNVDIAPNCTIVTGSHKIGNTYRRAGEGLNSPVLVENGVWIGTGTTILGGSEIKKGTIVAACSLVKGELYSNTLYGGVPVKQIRKLINDEEL